MNNVLIYFTLKYKGYFHDIFKALKNKEFIPIEEIEEIDRKIKNREIEAITIIDEEYPEELKLINNPPFVLFYKGNKNLLKTNKIALTGDFKNENINKFLDEALFEISKNHTLVSNSSNKTIDSEIVDYFYRKNKNLILISPNGLKNPFIMNNDFNFDKNNTLILSEYPENSTINKRRLIQRNRITIGLSKALIIVSSYKDSKLLSLVSNVIDQGKDIYCFPGLQNSNDGNNLLIQDGAIMITSIKDNFS